MSIGEIKGVLANDIQEVDEIIGRTEGDMELLLEILGRVATITDGSNNAAVQDFNRACYATIDGVNQLLYGQAAANKGFQEYDEAM